MSRFYRYKKAITLRRWPSTYYSSSSTDIFTHFRSVGLPEILSKLLMVSMHYSSFPGYNHSSISMPVQRSGTSLSLLYGQKCAYLPRFSLTTNDVYMLQNGLVRYRVSMIHMKEKRRLSFLKIGGIQCLQKLEGTAIGYKYLKAIQSSNSNVGS